MKPVIFYILLTLAALIPASNSQEFRCDFNSINILQRSLDSDPQCELKVQNINRSVTKKTAKIYKKASSKEFESIIFCVDRNTVSVRHFAYPLHFLLECSAEYPLQFEFQGLKPVDDIRTYFHKVVKRNASLSIVSYNIVIDFGNKPKLTGKYIFSSPTNSSQKIEYYFFMENKEPILLHNKKIEHTLIHGDIAVVPCRSSNWNASILLYKVKRQENEKIALSSSVRFDQKEGFMLDWTNDTHEEGQYLCAIDKGNEVHGDSLSITLILQKNFTENTALKSVDTISLQVLNNSEALCEVNNNLTGFRPKSLNNIYIANPTQAKLQQECVFQGEYCLNTDQRVGGYKSHCMCLGIPQLEQQGIVMCETEDKNIIQEYFIGLDGRMYCDSTLIPIPSSAVISVAALNASKVDRTHYAFQNYAFECYISSYLLVKPIVWYKKLLNGTLIEEKMDYDRGVVNHPVWIDRFVTNLTPDTKEILCSASYWNSSMWVNSSVKLDVVVRKSPKIIPPTPTSTVLNYTANEMVSIPCKADGYPMPTLHWLLGEKVFKTSFPPKLWWGLPRSAASRNFSLELKFFRITPNDSGVYSCKAENEFGTDRVNYTINVMQATNTPGDHDNLAYQIAIRVPLGLLICVGVVLAAYLIVRYRQRIGLTKQEIKAFEKGNEFEMKNMTGYVHETIDSQPYDRNFEIDEHLKLESTVILGAGAYGIVLKGRFRGQSVAIKTTKAGADKMYLKALLSELKIMIHIGKHPQIVSFLGAKTNELHKGIVYIIVEYCPMGNLENVLRNQNRSLFVLPNSVVADEENDSPKNPQEPIYDESLCVCIKDLVLWSYQIACAMEHLTSRKVIHGDLATRNVLLVNRETVKVTDFGLSRKLYECIEYVKKQQEPLPWRWLAIESLQSMHFSSKSDVWSYGVTLWEIFSLGDIPYPGLSWSVDFADLLHHGLRLKIPKYTTEDIFSIMQTCWANRPEDRPSFLELVQSFHAQLLRFSVDYVELTETEVQQLE